MQNMKRLVHPVIKHRMDVKLQRKINAADTIRTWSIVRGDVVWGSGIALSIGWGDSRQWYGETRKSITCWSKAESRARWRREFCHFAFTLLYLEKETYQGNGWATGRHFWRGVTDCIFKCAARRSQHRVRFSLFASTLANLRKWSSTWWMVFASECLSRQGTWLKSPWKRSNGAIRSLRRSVLRIQHQMMYCYPCGLLSRLLKSHITQRLSWGIPMPSCFL